MNGYVHLFALPPVVADSAAVHLPQYQFTFNTGGNAFSKVFPEGHLEHFLADELGIESDLLDHAMRELQSKGKVTIAGVALSENKAAALGLEQAGVDY